MKLDETLSTEISQRIKSKAKTPFDNAYRAALATSGAVYVQGFVVITGRRNAPIEHAWIELGESIIDPTFPHLNTSPQSIEYFSAQRLSVKTLKAAIEEAKEDYPEDDPLPIYGTPPYEYYGDLMLGGKEYLKAFQAATAKCAELN